MAHRTPKVLAEELAYAVIEASGVDPDRIDADTINAAAFYARSEAEGFLEPYLAEARERPAKSARRPVREGNVTDLVGWLEADVARQRGAKVAQP